MLQKSVFIFVLVYSILIALAASENVDSLGDKSDETGTGVGQLTPTTTTTEVAVEDGNGKQSKCKLLILLNGGIFMEFEGNFVMCKEHLLFVDIKQ